MSAVMLAVDDSETIHKALGIYLKGLPVQVVSCMNGFEATKYLAKCIGNQQPMPAMILVDVLMPRVNGLEFATFVRQNVDTMSIPLYMLSSKEGQVDKAQGSLAGADGYFVKPFTRDALRDLVGRVLNVHAESSVA